MITPRAFSKELLPKGTFSFIVHLFDRVLIGTCESGQEDARLFRAIEQDEILEGHFFDGSLELFAARENGILKAYEPIRIKEPGNGEYDVVERCYELEAAPYNTVGEGGAQYNCLTVREQIDYEDDLAYVKYTMLYRLDRREEP